MFYEKLNDYINVVCCTSKELADASNVSESAICRYRNGKRIPAVNSENLNNIIDGIVLLAEKKSINNITKKKIEEDLNSTLLDENSDDEILRKKLNELIELFNINVAEMAKYLNFDPSYLSRIRNGKRQPAEPDKLIANICEYIIKRYKANDEKKILEQLLNCKANLSDRELLDIFIAWFNTNNYKKIDYVDDFLKKLDNFDLNEYIRTINFNKIVVPTLPFQLPTSKTYYGIEEMKQAELDFFKSTVLSRSKEPIFMCNDMPMEEMAKDIEFSKKWMYGLACAIKKGKKINIIHTIDRPLNEMMLGLESWIPLYMTGQIFPYYLNNYQDNTYCHLNYVSGTVALTGECIKGYHSKGKYYLTKNKDELAYYKNKANCLIKKAQPLMQICRKENKEVYNSFLTAEAQIEGTRHGILSIPPIYTLPVEELAKILEHNKISNDDKDIIIKFVFNQKQKMNEILKNNKVYNELLVVSREEFDKYPISLSLTSLFYEKRINYTYEEYIKHIEYTKEYKKYNDNYILKINNDIVFRNIQIFIRGSKWVMISKDNAPTTHFIICNPKLCDAIEKFVSKER